MSHPFSRRILALVGSVALLATSTLATVAAPVAAGTPRCMGKPATIVGTAKGETIVGTAKGDVIVARGGHDRIFGRGGHDIICGNGGHDRIVGGPGNDRVLGGPGRDTLLGGPDRDTLRGGPGNDAFIGGLDWDLCYQGSGSGSVTSCEVGSIPWLAIAYSDLTGDHVPNKGDVLISKLVDANGDGVVSAGDTIIMGRYPTTLVPTSPADFQPWGVQWHVVQSVPLTGPDTLRVTDAYGSQFHFYRYGFGSDRYLEESLLRQSHITDAPGASENKIQLHAASPSKPETRPPQQAPGVGDERLIDVEIDS